MATAAVEDFRVQIIVIPTTDTEGIQKGSLKTIVPGKLQLKQLQRISIMQRIQFPGRIPDFQ